MAAPSNSVLTATDIRVRFNEQVVLDGASLSLIENERVGMVGRNGAGKSTLLRILTGEMTPDSGAVTFRRGYTIASLSQQFEFDPNKTVLEAIRLGAREMLSLINEFESLPAGSARHDELEHRIALKDGWNLERT